MGIRAGIYRHYRGGLYQVIGVAQHTETNEWLVVYVSLTGAHLPGPRMRARPLNGPDGWATEIQVPNQDHSFPRFEYVGLEMPQ